MAITNAGVAVVVIVFINDCHADVADDDEVATAGPPACCCTRTLKFAFAGGSVRACVFMWRVLHLTHTYICRYIPRA